MEEIRKKIEMNIKKLNIIKKSLRQLAEEI